MAECRICSGELELRGTRQRRRGDGRCAVAVRARGRPPRRPARVPRVRHGPAARAPVRRAAARPLPRHARRRVSGRGGRPARDREPPARPDRRPRARAAGCSTSAAATACCSTRRASAATRRSGSSSRARPLGTRARRSARRPRAAAGGVRRGPQRRLAGRVRRDRARRRARAPRRSGRRDRRAARALLRPGGVSASSRPIRPRSRRARPARAGGATCPRHTVLLPRRTLRELISARGLVISADVPFVRTFAARRWVGGLAERLGPLSGPLNAVAERMPAVTLEPLARRRARDPGPPHAGPHPVEPLLSNNGDGRAVHVVLPAYRATRTIPDVVAEMPVEAADRALLIDDASAGRDEHGRAAHGLDVLRTPPTAATAPRRRPATCARCATARR